MGSGWILSGEVCPAPTSSFRQGVPESSARDGKTVGQPNDK